MSVYVRLAAPIQSWAGKRITSTFVETLPIPTFSGLSGMLAAALGMPIGVTPSWFEQLSIKVRVDDRGEIFRSIQTISSRFSPLSNDDRAKRFLDAANAASIKSKKSDKQYLEMYPVGAGANQLAERTLIGGATFLVEFSAPGHEDEILEAFTNPVYSPYLGRKSCTPTFPFLLGSGEDGLLETLPTISGSDRLEMHEVTLSNEGSYIPGSYASVESVDFGSWLTLVSEKLSLTV